MKNGMALRQKKKRDNLTKRQGILSAITAQSFLGTEDKTFRIDYAF